MYVITFYNKVGTKILQKFYKILTQIKIVLPWSMMKMYTFQTSHKLSVVCNLSTVTLFKSLSKFQKHCQKEKFGNFLKFTKYFSLKRNTHVFESCALLSWLRTTELVVVQKESAKAQQRSALCSVVHTEQMTLYLVRQDNFGLFKANSV